MEIKMFRFAFLFLACSMCMSIVTCERILSVENVPLRVNRLDVQCYSAGHLGSCHEMMLEMDQLDCSHIVCASQRQQIGDIHRAVDIGLAANGTHCDYDSICHDGSCVKIPPNASMPQEIGGSVYGHYKCVRPVQGRPDYPRNRMR